MKAKDQWGREGQGGKTLWLGMDDANPRRTFSVSNWKSIKVGENSNMVESSNSTLESSGVLPPLEALREVIW